MDANRPDPRYIVTALNRLTGEREPVSRASGEERAAQLLRQARINSRKRSGGRCYTLFRMERVQPKEAQIEFTAKEGFLTTTNWANETNFAGE